MPLSDFSLLICRLPLDLLIRELRLKIRRPPVSFSPYAKPHREMYAFFPLNSGTVLRGQQGRDAQ